MILPQTWSDCVEQQHDYQLFRFVFEAPLPSSHVLEDLKMGRSTAVFALNPKMNT